MKNDQHESSVEPPTSALTPTARPQKYDPGIFYIIVVPWLMVAALVAYSVYF